MNIHTLALSHIVAEDHATMITLVQQIKAEEAVLDEKLAAYETFVAKKDMEIYRSPWEDYEKFKAALVHLACASADSKTQDAYATANGDVANWSRAVEEDVATLYASVNSQASSLWPRRSGSFVNTSLRPFGTLWGCCKTAPKASGA